MIKNELIPMLNQEINASNLALENIINFRLQDFTTKLETDFLTKIQFAISNLATTNDDFTYLYTKAHAMLLGLILEVRAFSSQPSTIDNENLAHMIIKMKTLLTLMEKNRHIIFKKSSSPDQEIEAAQQTGHQLFPKTLLTHLKQYDQEARPHIHKLNELKEIYEHEQTLLTYLKCFVCQHLKIHPDLDELQAKINTIKNKSFLSIIRTQREYKSVSIYLEYEEITPVTIGIRHYGIGKGINALSRLPSIIEVHEDIKLFNISTIKSSVSEALH